MREEFEQLIYVLKDMSYGIDQAWDTHLKFDDDHQHYEDYISEQQALPLLRPFERLPLFRSCVQLSKLTIDNLEIIAPRKEFLTVMDQVHQFFDHYENRTHGVPLNITVWRLCITLHLRLLTEKVPRGDCDWACAKETLIRALGMDEC
ncbi:hypothetical protein BG006_003026 [Podila minutissima]|uniref:Uncharacterized protein n=1 Tax=Podila minutissima TaxID=64525 RepID=A0A9P5VNG9_9FUNG|nr:hypothetical protein BG006_003026 [Podila minutissima]